MAEKEYIEREAAIDALTERNLVVHMDSVNDGLVASCHRSAQRVIANMPAADVRPVVRAYWKSVPHKRARVCSRCEADEPYKFADDDANVYNFCPNCGADMRPEPPKEE